MQLSHVRPVVSATFDEPNLVGAAGLVPLMSLARKAGLRELADERMSVPTDKGANAGLKLSSLVAGMAAGADSIDDMALLRHGGMGKVFTGAYAPSTLGSFLRSFTFGHVRQADAVASRFLLNLAEHTELLGSPEASRAARLTGGHRSGAARPRRHRRGGARLRQAGRGVRLLRGAGPQRGAGHSLDRDRGPGDRRAAAAHGQRRLRARSGAAGHRRPRPDRPHPAGRADRAAPGGLGVLLPRPGRRGADRRR